LAFDDLQRKVEELIVCKNRVDFFSKFLRDQSKINSHKKDLVDRLMFRFRLLAAALKFQGMYFYKISENSR
jgi:hypothetical protein